MEVQSKLNDAIYASPYDADKEIELFMEVQSLERGVKYLKEALSSRFSDVTEP